MKRFVVSFEIFMDSGKLIEKVRVEAGNKKLAAIRAMQEINKKPEYTDRYKSVISVTEAA